MKRFKGFQKNKSIRATVFALCLAFVASVISQSYTNINIHAANTLTGTTNEVITIATTDSLSPNAAISPLGFSGNGDTILFTTKATNLPNAGGVRYSYEGGLYTYTISTNTTTRMDIAASGTLPDRGSSTGIISDSGRYVYFLSTSTNLIDGTTQYSNNAYIRDLQAGTITAATNEYWGDSSNYIDYLMGISNDGRFIMFASNRSGVGVTNFYNAVLGDRKTGSFTQATLGQASGMNTVDVNRGGLSCDGSSAVFVKNGYLYLADLRNGTASATLATLISGSTSAGPVISCSGDYILYATQNRTDVSPTPTGLDTYLHLVEYNRVTGQRSYIDSDSTGVFSSGHFTYAPLANPTPNSSLFDVSIANTGDVVLKYNGNYYLKHISDGSGTLESVGKTTSGTYISVAGKSFLTSNGRYIFFTADPYYLGIGSSPAGNQIIRTKTNL